MNVLTKSLPNSTTKMKSPDKGSFSMPGYLYAAEMIHEYIQEYLFAPTASWSEYEFERRSYSRWAAYELVDQIMDRPLDAPIDTIEKFMFKMAYYAYCSVDERRCRIFQTAVETAEELVLLFV